MSPYASVIIPTHDRAATLATAVESVRRQSVRDLEIIISGDGVTAEVRDIAQGLALADSRVRFLDQPKAPGRGGLNRDNAVRAARSDRIFYTDDDDLWLPNHVARLGHLLDEADIADSLIASVGLSGALHVSLVDNSQPVSRESFAAGQGKTVFDTHLAHRKSAYFRIDRSWVDGSPGILFAAFAADRSITWRSIGAVTALSLHGAARAAMTAAQRLTEISTWFARLNELEQRGILSFASSAWWAFHTASGRGWIEPPPASFAILTEAQQDDFRAAVALETGQIVGRIDWHNLLSQLFDRVLTEIPCELLAHRLFDSLGADAALAELHHFSNVKPALAGRIALVSAYILVSAGRDPVEIEAALALALNDNPERRAEALLILARLRALAAVDLATAATELAPYMVKAWTSKFDYALAAESPLAARDTLEQLRSLWSRNPKLLRQSRLEKMERILEHHLKPGRRAAIRQAKAAAKATKRNKAADHEAKSATKEP